MSMKVENKIAALNNKLCSFYSNINDWMSFLKTTAGRMYKYKFPEQVLIYSQNPKATACAEYKTWIKACNRNVARNSKGISLIYYAKNGEPKLRYVFDISQTVPRKGNSKEPFIWSLTNNHYSDVVNVGIGGVSSNNLESTLSDKCDELYRECEDEYLSEILSNKGDSLLSELDDYNIQVKFQRLVQNSIKYTVLCRCNLNTSDFEQSDFKDICEFNNTDLINTIGAMTSAVSEEVLRTIERIIKNERKSEIYDEQVRSSSKGDSRERNNLHTGRGNGNISSTDGTGDNGRADRQVRSDEISISQGTQAVAVFASSDKGDNDESPSGDRRNLQQQDKSVLVEKYGEIRDNRGASEQRPGGVGTQDEYSAQNGGGTDTERDNLRIDIATRVHQYGYEWDGMEYYDTAAALDMWDKGYPVYMLYPDNSEHLAENRKEIEDFDGFFGVERNDIQNNKIRTAEATLPEAPAVLVLEEENVLPVAQVDENLIAEIAPQLWHIDSHKNQHFLPDDFKNIFPNSIYGGGADGAISNIEAALKQPAQRLEIIKSLNKFVKLWESDNNIFSNDEISPAELLSELKAYNDSKTLTAYRKGSFYEIRGEQAERFVELMPGYTLTTSDGESVASFTDQNWHNVEDSLNEKGYMLNLYSVLFEYKFPEIEPIIEGEPTVSVTFSEHPIFYDNENTVMSFRQADKLFAKLDAQQQVDRQNEDLGAGWYHKTDFIVKYTIDGEENNYEGRYDIGDGEGGLYQHIKNYVDYLATSDSMRNYYKEQGGKEYEEYLEYIEYAQNTLLPYLQQFSISEENVLPVAQSDEQLPDVTEEHIKSILLSDTFMKTKKSEIVGFFLSEGDENEQAAFIQSAYNDNYTEIVINNEIIGYHAENDGLLMWEGSFNDRTAETKLTWQLVSNAVSEYIKSHIYYTEAEIEKQIEYIDIEPEKEENGEQLTFFDLSDESIPTAEYTVPVDAISPEHIDNILRCGSFIHDNSVKEIIAFFKKTNKSDKQRAEFLKQHFLTRYRGEKINDTAIGFESDDSRFSAYYAADGIAIKPGNSIFTVGGKTRYMSWAEVAERINKMLENGTFAEQSIIDSTREHEATVVSNELWELYREQDDNAAVKFELDDVDVTYTTECLPQIAEKIVNDRTWLENIAAEMKKYAEAWKLDKSIQRFNGYIYNPVTVSERLHDMFVKERKYTAAEYVPLSAQPYINTDHVEMYFRKHGFYENGKETIKDYFNSHVDSKAQATFIKHHYGNGGSYTGEFEFNGLSNKEATFALYINRQSIDKKTVSWAECAKIISRALKSERYDEPVLFFSTAEETIESVDETPELNDTAQADNLAVYMQSFDYAEEHGEAEADYSAYIGKEFEHEGRRYKVDKINVDLDEIKLVDLTFAQNSGFPIVRSEPLSGGIDWLRVISDETEDKQEVEQPTTKIDYVIPDDNYTIGGEKTKFKDNVAAIKLLKEIEADRRNATAEEQKVLAKYVGWGGLSAAFNSNNSAWTNEFSELKSLLSSDEYAAARESTMTAYYTNPAIIREIWNGIEKFGFEGGNVLEPAMGTGNFFGTMPENIRDNSKLYGVELDSLSGRLAKQLYQSANISITGYEKKVLHDNFFDMAVGNVPFGQIKLNDRRYNSLNLNIHDYFFAKTLDKVRPGGIIAFITTSGTLDKQSSKFRKYLAQRAELIGAVRLPNNAFGDTEVTSDILFLQKRDKIQVVNSENCEWLDISYNEDGVPMNNYFVLHPEMIMGTMKQGVEYSLYGNADATACVAPEGYDLIGHLHDAILSIDAQYVAVQNNADSKNSTDKAEEIPADERVKNFSFCLSEGKLYYRENSIMRRVTADENRIKSLVALRDCTRELIRQQIDGYEESVIANKRTELGKLYDEFIEQYGYINSSRNSRAFGTDSSYYLLCSLERFDKANNTYLGKADIFTKNTVNPVVNISKTDTALEALSVSIGEKGKVDIPYMSQLCGLSEEDTIKDCIEAEAIYDLPPAPDVTEENRYVTADEYLSGNIREKLNVAKMQVMLGKKEYERNVAALEAVMPKPLTATEIQVNIGVNWIDASDYEAFMHETFNTPFYNYSNIKVMYSRITGEFRISNKNSDRANPMVNVKYGTARMNAYEILENTLNLRTVQVRDRVEDADGKVKYVPNPKETEKAQERQELIKEAFDRWIFSDPERRERLVEKYNVILNSCRVREYDGSNIILHGVNSDYTLYPHQRNAVARTLYGGNTLLAHVVGAGKTFEMVTSAMEAKYLGVCHKSLICVPNHIVGQFANEFMALYPMANILVATEKDFEAKRRKLLCSKIATGDYDAVIIGHSQLLKIPLSTERQADYLQQEIDELAAAIEELSSVSGQRASFSVKQMEKTKKNLQTRYDKLLDSKRDDVVTFEELGIDRLYIDEAHMFKNLYLHTKMNNVAGIQQTEAQKSEDLYFKCKYLDEITGGKGVVFATGTPVSNSMTELYTMQRYLQASTLRRLGMEHFDAWAANYADITTAMELAPEGSGYRLRTRFAKFHNLPELMTVFKECADIKTADDLELDVPEAVFENICAKPTESQKELMNNLAARAKAVHDKMVQPEVDNMLKITSDGRKIGLDQRLINPLLPDEEGSKVNLCVDKVYDIWRSTEKDRLTQIVFCDFSTPKNDGTFNIYTDVRDKLIAKGVPEDEIAFIHDYSTDDKKQKLFAKVRKGDVRVLLGSTAKCGAGTNVQDKLIALHHIDCPWRPADLEQREGRIIRQGNTNEKVYVYRYVTEGTFDAYLYQIIENKQKGISQVMSSKSPQRVCDDVDEAVLNYSEVKALCAGNPLIKEKMELEIDVAKLKRLQSAYLSERYDLEDKLIKKYPTDKANTEKLLSKAKADLEYTKSLNREFTEMELKNKLYIDKKEAAEMLIKICRSVGSRDLPKIGTYKGFDMSVMFDMFGGGTYYLKLKNNLTYQIELGTDPIGNITRIENMLQNGIEKYYGEVTGKLEQINNSIQSAEEMLSQGWSREEELTEKARRLKEVDRLIMLNDDCYYKEVTPEQLDKLEKSGLQFEKAEKDNKIIVKVSKADTDNLNAMLSESKNLTP